MSGTDRLANSDEVLARICRSAGRGDGNLILIVPEQFSHEAERALCRAGGDTISRSAEVLSFTRLASRVFSLYGGVCEEYLDEGGRLLTMIDQLGYGRDDRRLAAVILPVYDQILCRVDPEAWMEDCREAYRLPENADAGDTVWGRELMDSAKRTVSYWFSSLGGIWRSLNADAQENLPLLSAYGDSMRAFFSALVDVSRFDRHFRPPKISS